MKICFVSSFLPRECGIATYTNNLMDAIKSADKNCRFFVVAMNDNKYYKYSPVVKFKIDQDQKEDYIKAAEFINQSDCDVVSIQHEFGIYGGFNGRKLLYLLKNLKKPIAITLHTVPFVLDKPHSIRAKRYRSRGKLLKEILKYVDVVSIMTDSAKTFLFERMNFPEKRIKIIPHGAPLITEKDQNKYLSQRKKIGLEEDDFVISTFGLISPKKGLEYVVKALPKIINKHPDKKIKYLVLGRNHPKKPKTYLEGLKALVKKLGLDHNVLFNSHYLTYPEIYRYLTNTDVYITPYYAKEQASSGTLSYAISCGRCIVSTPYVFANDLINKYNVGKLVEFKNYNSVARALNSLIKNPQKIAHHAKNSREYGRSIEWGKIGEKFIEEFGKVRRTNENCNNSRVK